MSFGYGYGFSKAILYESTPIDPDVESFLLATGITNPTQVEAVTYLVEQLKSNGLWTKMYAVYPFVGGTSSSNSYNLKNTAQYQITWNGTITHNSNGVTGDGATGYGNTGLNINAIGGRQNDFSISIYIRNNMAAGNKSAMGTVDGATVFAHIYPRTAGNNLMIGVNNATTNTSKAGITSVGGFYQGSRIASNDIKGYRGTTQVINSTQASGTPSAFNVYVLARNALGTPQAYADINAAYCSMASGLTPSELVTHYNIVQQYQTILSRQV